MSRGLPIRGGGAWIAAAGCALLPALLVSAALAPDASAAARWVCNPGFAEDPCRTDMTTTEFHADGSTTVERSRPARNPRVDCFYVYPTISDQPGPNANWEVDPNIRGVATAQASRFSQTCRVFAPVYRQTTVPTLLAGGFTGGIPSWAREKAYGDVRDAWFDYLENYNRGRPVVLIGHSQGSRMLTRLVAEEIDKRPAIRRRLVSALLIGSNVVVRKGSDAGGDFQNVPACRSRTQTGCVVAYSSFLNVPPADSRFGRVGSGYSADRDPAAFEVLCNNPASLAGGRGRMQLYVPTERIPGLVGSQTDEPPDAPTPWASAPGLYEARCRTEDDANFLQVRAINPDDPRPRVSERPDDTWGLHIIDVNVAMGNLVGLVKAQVKAYGRTRGQ